MKQYVKLFVACMVSTAMGIAHSGVGTHGTGNDFGAITDFGSIFVNGVEYDISTATILINNVTSTQAALKKGMAVRVEGTINPGGLTGTATLVEYLGDLEGTIDATPAIAGKNGSFNIYGILVRTDEHTRYTDGDNLSTLHAGDAVEVSGFFNGNDNSFTATRIEKRNAFQKMNLRGKVSSLNTTAKTFVIGSFLVVTYRDQDLRDMPNTGIANGLFVEVKSDDAPIGGQVTAKRVNNIGSELATTSLTLGVMQGVTANVTAGGFVLGNQPVVINAQTVFDAQPATALAANVKAIAVGPVTNGVMTASFVTIPVALIDVKSRKTHGTAGTFDLPVDTNTDIFGNITVEPRLMGSEHTIVFHFDGPVTSVASVTSKAADGLTDVGAATFVIPPSGNEVIVSLTGVPDNKRTKITLNNINQTGNIATASIGFLIGDVNNTRNIDSSDVSAVKSRSGQITDSTNFRYDATLSGAIGSADLATVKARSNTTLAP
jgi:hypothetical protein